MLAEPMLHTRSLGTGPEWVLVHGWGLNADVWDELAAEMARQYRVTVVDLPGYGRSPLGSAPYTLTTLAGQLAAAVPRPAFWLGWSLGGLVCQQLAIDFPDRMQGLALVASSPRFVRGADWQQGIDPDVLTQFAWDLAADYRGTLLRFLALEARGSDHARQETKALRERVFRHGEPALPALQGGLALLRDSDLRHHLDRIRCPMHWVLGERDQLVPAATATAIATALPQTRCTVIGGAAHAPFLSHRAEFLACLEEFSGS